MQKETDPRTGIEENVRISKYVQDNIDTFETISNLLIDVFKRSNKVLLFGNGGSASIAEHIASDFSSPKIHDPPLPAIALTTNTSLLTQIGNDYCFEKLFSFQVKQLVKPGDVVIGISTSGNSPNVILGIKEAKRIGAVTVALTGQGGKLEKLVDHVLSVPSRNTQRIEEACILIGHIMVSLVSWHLSPDSQK
ncbi:MAG: SIS domain-containing protein [Chloroflexi bacterium]|nr:SIS domain-containing protein [Chloroflexota bacterium]